MTVTTGFAAATRMRAARRLSPPETEPPGLSTATMTALTLLSFASAATASRSWRSSVMTPRTLMRTTCEPPMPAPFGDPPKVQAALEAPPVQ